MPETAVYSNGNVSSSSGFKNSSCELGIYTKSCKWKESGACVSLIHMRMHILMRMYSYTL